MDLLCGGDNAEVGDHDHVVARTVEKLTVAGSDDPEQRQEKEASPVGIIPF